MTSQLKASKQLAQHLNNLVRAKNMRRHIETENDMKNTDQKHDALLLADSRPTHGGDDLYQWAIDAEEVIRRMYVRIAELEAELEAVGAGGVQRLTIAPQPCSRSHPHEEMTPMCELRTEIARLTNALARAEAQLAAAPQAVQAATESVLIDGVAYEVHAEVAAELLRLHIELQQTSSQSGEQEERRVCNNEECGWIGPLSETYGYKHSPATLCPECKETTELATPAHPAEGVPAPVTVVDAPQSLIEAIQFTPLGVRQIHAMERARATIAATHPTQQGLDARDSERFRKFAAAMLRQDPAFEEAIEAYPKPDFEIATIDDVRAMIDAGLAAVDAAQAKQGGV